MGVQQRLGHCGLGEAVGPKVAEGDVEPLSWALIELGRSVNGAQYLVSVQELQSISRQIADYFEGIDVLLTPPSLSRRRLWVRSTRRRASR